MRLPDPTTAVRRITLPLAVVALVAACSGTSPTAAPPSPNPVDPTPVIATPTAAPEGTGYWLRLTVSQALPPVNVFAFTPAAVITAEGLYVMPGAVPAIYPGPLVTPLFARQVSDAGREQILAWAAELGLLSGETDFTGDLTMPGGMTGRIELTVDGRLVALSGVPDAARSTEPGTPGAWAELWARITMLSETLGGELGPEEPFVPAGYAILVGPAPVPEAGIQAGIADWPLDVAMGSFGGPVQDGSYRCGLVEGDDAALLRPALEQANQLTQWVQDPETSATFGLTVRPIVAGENPCAEVFGF